MILKNYWNYLNGIQKGSIGDGIKTLSGGVFPFSTSEINVNNVSLSNKISIKLGSGEDEVEADDYSMDGDITSSLSSLTFSNTMTSDENGIRRVVTVSGANNTSSSITVNQIGLVKHIDASGMGSGVDFLILKVKLNNPLTISSNTSLSITLEWTEA